MEQVPQPQTQDRGAVPAQEQFKQRALVQKALMLQAGVGNWFKGDTENPISLAERFSDYWDNAENATKCLTTDLNNPIEVNKLLEAVRSYKKGETVH